MLLLGRCPWYRGADSWWLPPPTSSSSQDTRMGQLLQRYLNSKGGAP